MERYSNISAEEIVVKKPGLQPEPGNYPIWISDEICKDLQFAKRAWNAVTRKRPGLDWPAAIMIWKAYMKNPAKVKAAEEDFPDLVEIDVKKPTGTF